MKHTNGDITGEEIDDAICKVTTGNNGITTKITTKTIKTKKETKNYYK